jgi:hypothetical protein
MPVQPTTIRTMVDVERSGECAVVDGVARGVGDRHADPVDGDAVLALARRGLGKPYTRYWAGATPYPGRTCTGWNSPAFLAHQTFRRLHACPDCFRRALSPGGFRTHSGKRRLFTAHTPQRKFSPDAAIFTLSLFAGLGFRIEPLRRFAPEIAPANSQRSETMSDIVFLVLGLGLIGVMALYAHALTRA